MRRSPRWQERWLRRLYDRRRDRSIEAVGFKTKLKDVWDLAAFTDLLRSREVRIIALRRRNVVKLAVSAINARRIADRTGRWNRHAGSDPLGPLQVEPDELRSAIEKGVASQEELAGFVDRLGLATLRLDYEDLLGDRSAWLDQVTTFLGLSNLGGAALRSDVEKATDDDLSKALANYERLAEHFRGEPYARDFSVGP